MARTRSAAKRQRLAVDDSALANVDVVSHLASFLEAKDLCQVRATCKALGSSNDDAAFNGLSMVEEAARRVYEDASDEEKATLPRYNGEGWTELYHHLLMLRARLTFDQLVGKYVKYRGGDKAAVQGVKIDEMHRYDHSICGHIMRAGRHWASFTSSSGFEPYQTVGVIRPLHLKGLEFFYPCQRTSQNLQQERTDRWEGVVHCCRLNARTGLCSWSDWVGNGVEFTSDWEGHDEFDRDCTTLGMLLDLGEGTLSLYQNGQRLGTLKDGLAGEYCWTAGFCGRGNVSIRRGYNGVIV